MGGASNNSTRSKMLNAAILQAVDNQLRAGDPPEARQTLDRLLASGLSEQESRRLIACALINEIWSVTTTGQPYDAARYIATLERLPEMPEGWDDDE